MVKVSDFLGDNAFCRVEFVAGGLDLGLHGFERFHEFELLVFDATDVRAGGFDGGSDGLELLVFASLRALRFVLLDLFAARADVFLEHRTFHLGFLGGLEGFFVGTSQGGEAAFEGGARRGDRILFGDEFADGQVAFLKEEELFEDWEHGCMKHSAGGQGKGNRA